jgi:hypothetical protein
LTDQLQDSSITGYGSIHAAILAVASSVLRNGFSTSTFHPQTDAEIADAQVADLGMTLDEQS